MQGCIAAVFVCGSDTHNSPWINREAELAKSQGLGIVVFQTPRSTGGIPNELRALNPPVIHWEADALCRELNRIFSQQGIKP